MNLRPVGAALLGLGMLAAAAIPRLTAPGLAGDAAVAPLIEPRPGDCVVQLVNQVRVVPCGGRHTAEVAAVWSAAVASGQQRAGVLSDSCNHAAADYLGVPAEELQPDGDPDWITSPVDYSAVVAPRGQPRSPAGFSTGTTAALGWRVCLVRPTIPSGDPGYRGQLRGVSAMGTLPVGLRTCYTGDSGSPAIPCTTAHSGEVIAQRTVTEPAGQPGTPADKRVYQQDCASVTARRIESTDPTVGGALVVRLHAVQVGFVTSAQNPTVVPLSAYPPKAGGARNDFSGVLFELTCAVEVTGPGRLIGSVLGLGDGPLPLG